MRAKSLAGLGYTHVHWAFADIHQYLSFSIDDTHPLGADVKGNFAYDGWAFSTDPARHQLLRRVCEPGNRDALVTAVVASTGRTASIWIGYICAVKVKKKQESQRFSSLLADLHLLRENIAETDFYPAVITKAGAGRNEVIVGILSYDGSLEMEITGCTGPLCTFFGPESTEKQEKSTLTPGCLANAVIDELIRRGVAEVTPFYDSDTQYDYLI
ncbi:uncharacterized protein PgNI_08675 [Pyricularia grisea]|uniref:Uncharacterized protein n=1 Tax=Pyricularia grisea TaxID=148305 RepID=A0A6P8AX37_PYRGI|nr:uncharacterized protein PgNI_08675 [Pyricularia grisea]TLD06724.1 hypothetical protein PgNI_08675 [Pyricularia grisea]